MQDTYEITIEEMKKAMKDGYSVLIIINGEWYELTEQKQQKRELIK